jgi:hypothetical protein
MKTQVEQLLIDQMKKLEEIQQALSKPDLYMKMDERAFLRGHMQALKMSIDQLQQILEIDEDLSEIMF